MATKKTELANLKSSLQNKLKLALKEDLKTITDENGFVRIDPRFLTNI